MIPFNFCRFFKSPSPIVIKAMTVAVIHFLFTFINDEIIFSVHEPNLIHLDAFFFLLSKIIVFLVLLFLWYGIFKIYLSNKCTKVRLSIFSIYFFIQVVLLAVCWPGIWRWDDLITLGSISAGQLYYWQHWLSSIYTFVCLQIVPIPGGVVFCQILLISLVVEQVIWLMYSSFKTKLVFLCFNIYIFLWLGVSPGVPVLV